MIACAPTQKLRVLDMLLLCNDLDKDAVNNRGMTALHQAAWYGQEKTVDMLLRAGAALDVKTPADLNIDIPDNHGVRKCEKRKTEEESSVKGAGFVLRLFVGMGTVGGIDNTNSQNNIDIPDLQLFPETS